MDNLTLKEELQILKAASLAGSKAPENLDTKRSREFVRGQMSAGKNSRKLYRFTPAMCAVLAFAACAAAVIVILNPGPKTDLDVMQLESIHAAADSTVTAGDSLKTASPETFELMEVNE